MIYGKENASSFSRTDFVDKYGFGTFHMMSRLGVI